MKNLMIRIGNFLFKHRNHAFPIIIFALFMVAVPPRQIFGSEQLEHAKDGLAFLIALLGLACRATVIGYAYIKRGGLNKKVYAQNLVTEGMFSLCRNPLYVGNMLIYFGVFLMHGNFAVILIGTSLFLFIYQCIIYAEEAYLREKFGKGYDEYCRDVPRWFPELLYFKKATNGMTFNIRRVIMKDYTTIANTIVTLAIVEFYEYLVSGTEGHHIYLTSLAMIVLILLISVGIIKYIKKHPAAHEVAR